MGRYGKEHKRISFKCEYGIYEEFENFRIKFNKKNNQNVTLTKLLEVAMYEFIERNKDKI